MPIQPDYFRSVVSGEEQSLSGVCLRGLLAAAESLSVPLIRCRNALYDWNVKRIVRVGAPVVSIGNLTMGGTGKTPLSCAIVDFLQSRGLRPAIISRGYKAKPGELNDEAREVLRRSPELIYVQNPQREKAARELLERSETDRPDVLVLDDGFQRRQLARDFDIVLLDAQNPFGFGRVCPRGFLREPVSGLRRADAIILTRSDSVSSGLREQIREQARELNPTAIWSEATHRPASWQGLSGSVLDVSGLSGLRALAFCALGNPAAFRKTVEQSGLEIAAFLTYPDHHQFTVDEAQTILDQARLAHADAIVCSMKDFVKWPLSEAQYLEATDGRISFWGLQIDFQFTQSGDEFWSALERVCRNCRNCRKEPV